MLRLAAVCVIGFILVASGGQALAAFIYATGATVVSTTNASADPPSAADGPPDGNRMTVRQSGTSTDVPGEATIDFAFSGVSYHGGIQKFRIVTDAYKSDGTQRARITGVNGSDFAGFFVSPWVSFTGTSGQDQGWYVSTDFGQYGGLDDHDTITSIRITFDFPTYRDSVLVDTVGTPEPGTFALVGIGLAGLGLAGWRRRSNRRKS